MTVDRRFDPEEPASGADDALIAALALYDEARDSGSRAEEGVTAPFDAEFNERFSRLRGVLDELARLRDAETPRAGGEESSAEASVVAAAEKTPHSGHDEPRKIGRFVILEELGRGGHGIVFRAHDPVLGRDVALKVPRPELLLSKSARQRFLREGRSTASLSHPNLVAVFEAGEAGPVCYLAQEYCPGPNLETWIRSRSRPIPPRQAVELVAQLAEGVDYAHRRGVVHRDLKPGNVLMQPTTRSADMNHQAGAPTAGSSEITNWTPRIVDFGLAQLEESSATLTATGALVGTPAYMAPEQLEPARGEVGPASDIYALGGILFQVLTGQTPYRSASQTELIKQILLDPPRSLRSLRREVPPDLDAICQRALEKRPADRYVTAGDLADDLRRFSRGEPTLARPLKTYERLVRWARRKPWAAALVVVIGLSLVSVGTMTGVYTVRLRGALTEAERSRQATRAQLYASDIGLAQDALASYRVGESIDILEKQFASGDDPDLREFCWGYLWNQTHRAARELRAHRGAVYSVEYSPEGKLLVSAGEDGVVRVWEASTGRLRQELAEHHSEVNAVAFSADGRQLATVSDAGELILWSVGEQIELSRKVKISDAKLFAVCFSPDGQRIAVGCEDCQVRIVSAAEGDSELALAGHTLPVFAVAFWDGGKRLASGGRDGSLLDWDLTAGTTASPRLWLKSDGSAIRSISFSPDEKQLAVARGTLDVVPVPDGAILARLRQGIEDFSAVSFSHDGRRLLAANLDSTWRIGEWETDEQSFRVVSGHEGRVYSAAISPDDREVTTAGADGLVRQWSAASANLPYEITLDGSDASAVAFSANGDWLLLKKGRPIDPLTLEAHAWRDGAWQRVEQWTSADILNRDEVCAISADGRWVVRSGGGPDVLAWQVGVSREWQKIGTLTSRVANLTFGASGSRVLAANMEVLCAWELSPPCLLWKVAIPRSDVRNLASTDTIVAYSSGNTIGVLELATGKKLFSTELPTMEFAHLVLKADSREVLAAASDRSIYRWGVPDGRPLEPWVSHAERVLQLAMHPNGRTVASLDAGGVMWLWHRETGRPILPLRKDRTETMAFSADGCYLHVVRPIGQHGNQVWSYRSTLPKAVAE